MDIQVPSFAEAHMFFSVKPLFLQAETALSTFRPFPLVRRQDNSLSLSSFLRSSEKVIRFFNPTIFLMVGASSGVGSTLQRLNSPSASISLTNSMKLSRFLNDVSCLLVFPDTQIYQYS